MSFRAAPVRLRLRGFAGSVKSESGHGGRHVGGSRQGALPIHRSGQSRPTSGGVSAFYIQDEVSEVSTFGELLERHEREIFAYALRLTGDRDDADDVYQETFLAAFRGWPPPRRGQERAWLYRIATNKVIDHARKAKRLVRMDDLRLAAPQSDGVSLTDLAAAVKVLPDGQRAAFVLRKVQGLDYADVARALECSQEAARSRVAEAMKKVKEAMR